MHRHISKNVKAEPLVETPEDNLKETLAYSFGNRLSDVEPGALKDTLPPR